VDLDNEGGHGVHPAVSTSARLSQG
jgi:hypothetical protein